MTGIGVGRPAPPLPPFTAPDPPVELAQDVLDVLERAHWQSAKSVEDVAPHAYCVIGCNKDDLTDEEFGLVVRTIKEVGRLEQWTAPEGFHDSGKRPRKPTRRVVGPAAASTDRAP